MEKNKRFTIENRHSKILISSKNRFFKLRVRPLTNDFNILFPICIVLIVFYLPLHADILVDNF